MGQVSSVAPDHQLSVGVRTYSASIAGQVASQKILSVDQLTKEVVEAAEVNQTGAITIYLEAHALVRSQFPTLVKDLATPAWRELEKIATRR